MAIVGRMQLDHPALGAAAGAGLHADIESIYEKISDANPGRFYAFTSVADSATFNVVHDFGVNLIELDVFIYSGTWPSLTAINGPEYLSVPWGIAETGGNELRSITITAPSSGGFHTGAVLVLHNKGREVKAARVNIAVSGAANLADKRTHLADSTGGGFTLTLPSPDADLFIPIKDVGGDASNNNITIATPGAETIDGAASFLINADYQSVVIVSDGTNYFIL